MFLTSRAFYKELSIVVLLPALPAPRCVCVFFFFLIQACLGSVFFLIPFHHSHSDQHWTLRRDCMWSYKTIDLRCNQALFWHVVDLVYTWCVDAHLLYLQSPLWLLTYCMLFDFLIFLDTREMYVWICFCSLQTVCVYVLCLGKATMQTPCSVKTWSPTENVNIHIEINVVM